jgi:hypothetical protein
MDKPKDFWDKLDVVGKIVSTVLLAVIAFFLKEGSDNISFSLQKGYLVQTLITDLTDKQFRTKQDVALLALNHFVGEKDSSLVSEIAERLYLDISTDTSIALNGKYSAAKVAFDILKQRNPRRAEELIAELTSTAVKDSGSTNQSVSRKLLAQVYNNLVYVQFRGKIERHTVDSFRTILSQGGFTAPGAEKLEGDYKSAVRYFHKEDGDIADSVKNLAQKFFPDLDFLKGDMSERKLKAPRGQVEIWISFPG